MLTTLPVIGVAYLIRIYFGRVHWASATLYGLLAWFGTFTFLVEFTGAETPLSMSVIAAVISGGILVSPDGSIPGIKADNESVNNTKDTNEDQHTNDDGDADHSGSSPSDLPELKAELKKTRQLLSRLQERKDEVSPERYERLHQQYEEEIEKLESKVTKLTEQGTTRKIELEDRLADRRNQEDEIEAELKEIELLYEEGAMREKVYQEECRQLQKKKEKLEEESSQIEKEIEDIEFYLRRDQSDSYRKEKIQKTNQEEVNQDQRGRSGQLGDGERVASRSLWGRLVAVMVIAIIPVVGYWLQGRVQNSPEEKTATSEPPTSERTASRPVMSERAMFRGGPARTGVYTGSGPEAPINVSWAVEVTPSGPWSPPVVAGGTVYFGTYNPFTQGNHYVYALDAATGQEQWRFETENGVSSSPSVVEGTVYVGNGAGHVYALNAETGQEQWRFEAGEVVNTSPAVVGGTVYVGNSVGDIYALNAATGQEQWRFETHAAGPVSAPAVVGGTVYVGSSDDTDASDYVYALNAETGRKQWSAEIGREVSTSLAVAGGTVYVACTSGIGNIGYPDHENYIYALSSKSGQMQWSFEANGRTFNSIAVSEGSVYVGSDGRQAGDVYSLDAESGQQQWRFETTDPDASAVLAGSSVYIEDGYRVYAVNVETGRKQWHFRPSQAPAYLAVDGATMYLGSSSGYLYALE